MRQASIHLPRQHYLTNLTEKEGSVINHGCIICIDAAGLRRRHQTLQLFLAPLLNFKLCLSVSCSVFFVNVDLCIVYWPKRRPSHIANLDRTGCRKFKMLRDGKHKVSVRPSILKRQDEVWWRSFHYTSSSMQKSNA